MALRQLTDEVMFEIRRLTGQNYDDSYATKASKPAQPSAPATAPASSSTVLTGAGGEVRHGRHLRTGTQAPAPGGSTRPSSGSVLTARPLVPAGSSPVPAPDPAAAREQAAAAVDTSSDHDLSLIHISEPTRPY